jgi:hypothetical protein
MSTVRTLITAYEIVNQGIVKAAPFSNRFDAAVLASQIDLAEQRFLKIFINPEFYEDLKAQRTPNEIQYNSDLGAFQIAYPNNADYEELFTQYLYPYICRAVIYESYPYIAIQTESNGVIMNQPSYGQNAGVKVMQAQRDTMLGTLEGTKPIIIKYLCDNKDKYPLWDSSKYCDECKQENEEGRKIGFVFKK